MSGRGIAERDAARTTMVIQVVVMELVIFSHCSGSMGRGDDCPGRGSYSNRGTGRHLDAPWRG